MTSNAAVRSDGHLRVCSSCARVLFIVSLLVVSSCRGSGVSPGANAPGFRLLSVQGSEVRLSDFQGKKVILCFWATWCPPCLEELPSLQKLHESLRGTNHTVIGIATQDTREDVLEWKEKLGITFSILIDDDGEVARRYKATGFPETFLVDERGKIQEIMDPDHGIRVLKVVGPRDWQKFRF